MAVFASPYAVYLSALHSGDIDVNDSTFMVMAVLGTYTPDFETDVLGDVTPHEHPANDGYVTGGFAIADVVGSYDSATSSYRVVGDNVVEEAQLTDVQYFVVYITSGLLVGYIDLGEEISSAPDTGFEIRWSGHDSGVGGTIVVASIP